MVEFLAVMFFGMWVFTLMFHLISQNYHKHLKHKVVYDEVNYPKFKLDSMVEYEGERYRIINIKIVRTEIHGILYQYTLTCISGGFKGKFIKVNEDELKQIK